MLAAAAAWDDLATELQSTASSYSSVIATLTSGPWVGPSSVAMAAAVTPYVAWMRATATQAHEAAAQATAAASAYEAAFAAHVPPPEIAANRSQLAALVATNIVGQNTAAIAASEAQYGEMWAQDAVAMESYLTSSAAASALTPFTEPPQTTSTSGTSMQAAAVTAAAATPVGNAASTASAAASTAFDPLGGLAELATDYTAFWQNLLNTVPNGNAWYSAMYNAVKVPIGLTTQFNDVGLLINLPLSQYVKFATPLPYGALPKEALGAGLGQLGAGRGTLFNSVRSISTGMGNAGSLAGRLSVPTSWATATPEVRTVAAALSAGGAEAVPAVALGQSGLLSSMPVAGMMGAGLGAGAPSVVGAGVRGRLTPLKDLKNKQSPEQLKRLVAQISEKPESVQHHNVDQQGLDALLEQLARKPGIHAVHLRKGDKSKIVPSEAQMG